MNSHCVTTNIYSCLWRTTLLLAVIELTTQNPRTRQLEVLPGATIHLFPRYGYLSLAIRVLSEPDRDSPALMNDQWIFMEPSQEIFLPSTVKILEKDFLDSMDGTPEERREGGVVPLKHQFQVDFCEDVDDLEQMYFSRFNIEGVEKPWQAFTGGWKQSTVAKYFGIEPTFLKGDDHRFMLVRVALARQAGVLRPLANVTVDPAFKAHVDSFEPQDYSSSFKFFNEVGTHYISSYLTGNSLYQVFVLDEEGYRELQRRVGSKGWIQASYMTQMAYLLPLWVKHIGKIMVLHSGVETARNVQEALTIQFPDSVYPNIFKMHGNVELVKLVEKYLEAEPKGLLALELNTLDILFQNNTLKQKWFLESLHHTIHLWEVNLR